jgi:site-specific DNA-methyltransferase (adenine-specific)
MTPYFEDESVTIYHGDCREVLPELHGDALVTDPPYGIGWSRATWPDNPDDYPELMHWLVAEGNRIGGWCFVFQSMIHAPRYHEWFPPEWRIFAACKSYAQIQPTTIWHAWDPVIFWNSGLNNKPNTLGNRDYHVARNSPAVVERVLHPCPRPLDTMKHICCVAVARNDLIIDPFMGSGTTLRAAKDTGRRAIGIEIEERYCEIAAKRMAQQVLQFEEV